MIVLLSVLSKLFFFSLNFLPFILKIFSINLFIFNWRLITLHFFSIGSPALQVNVSAGLKAEADCGLEMF